MILSTAARTTVNRIMECSKTDHGLHLKHRKQPERQEFAESSTPGTVDGEQNEDTSGCQGIISAPVLTGSKPETERDSVKSKRRGTSDTGTTGQRKRQFAISSLLVGKSRDRTLRAKVRYKGVCAYYACYFAFVGFVGFLFLASFLLLHLLRCIIFHDEPVYACFVNLKLDSIPSKASRSNWRQWYTRNSEGIRSLDYLILEDRIDWIGPTL